MRLPLSMIVAMSSSRIIGAGGRIPWHEPKDLQFFRTVTGTHAIIMGRRTHESIGFPLPRRRNIVVSRQPGYYAPGTEVYADLLTAITAARDTDPAPMIIGGAQIYEAALPLATTVYVTEVAGHYAGDTVFPILDGLSWRLDSECRDGHLTFRTYVHRCVHAFVGLGTPDEILQG